MHFLSHNFADTVTSSDLSRKDRGLVRNLFCACLDIFQNLISIFLLGVYCKWGSIQQKYIITSDYAAYILNNMI